LACCFLLCRRCARQRRACSAVNNVKQLGVAVHNYQSAHGKVPPAWTPDNGGGTLGSNANASNPINGTIHFLLLPYIEQDNLYRAANGRASNRPADIVKTYLCPSDSSLSSNIQRYGYASTNYAANIMVFDPRGTNSIEVSMPDGTSSTVIFAERYKVSAPSWSGYTGPAWAMHPQYVGHGWDSPVIGWRDPLVNVGYDPSFVIREDMAIIPSRLRPVRPPVTGMWPREPIAGSCLPVSATAASAASVRRCRNKPGPGLVIPKTATFCPVTGNPEQEPTVQTK